MTKTRRWTRTTFAIPFLALLAYPPLSAAAQGSRARHRPTVKVPSDSVRMADMADQAMEGDGPMDENMMKHLKLTPLREPTHDDSVRAAKVASDLEHAIARYRDTAAAVADGYHMLLPGVKGQRVYHFTNNRRAVYAVAHFDATKPTSILYKRGPDGALHLIGAMYTAAKNASPARLDDRVPLGIARWHKHVDWCLPKKGDAARWLEQKNGKPVFGPASPIATRAECNAVKGEFHPSLFGWMVHANVFEGHDLGSIWSDDNGHEHANVHASRSPSR